MRKISPVLAATALAAVAAVLMLSGSMLPGSGHPATAPAVRASATALAATAPDGSGAVQHSTSVQGTGARTVAYVRRAGSGAADSRSAAAGGLCSVPGIGDIGGLLGFCSLGSSGLAGDLNNICQPALPTPEPADSGIDSMIAPPATGKQPSTLYAQYGVAGDYWAATNLQCSDMTSLIGNNVAGMVFDAAKSIDRVTITVYQAAAGDGIVNWLQNVTDKLITSLGKAIYFPYLAVVVILAAIWLAWQGLIRKRATRTIEGTVWMIVACAAALFLIGKPAAVTGLGRDVSDGIGQALNTAFAKLPSPGASSCVPVQKGDPEVRPASYSYTSGSTVVNQNADELWTVLVCKPWLVGEFGTSMYTTGHAAPTVVNKYGRSLLWAQAIAVGEKATPALIQAKQAAYSGIASSIQTNDAAIYPLFQGNQWTTRLEVGFAALFAALVAGVLVLLIAVTLILLKLSFLLLLIVGPFFLLIGTHPGFGRVVALRWVELLVGVLLKQAAVALVLSLLLYCYTLIMGTSDAVLPWALKILMIALVTVAAFIYRKPFQHLFSAVGYGMIGSQQRAEADLAMAGARARANTIAAALAVPTMAASYRAARWTRRNPEAAGLGAAGSAGAAAARVAAGLQAGEPGAAADGSVAADGASAAAGGVAAGAGGGVALAARGRADGAVTPPASGQPPPLNLPPRNGASSAEGVGASGPGTNGHGTTGGSGTARRSGAAAGPASPVGSPVGPAGGPAPGGSASGWLGRGSPARGSARGGRVPGNGASASGVPGGGASRGVPGGAVPGGAVPGRAVSGGGVAGSARTAASGAWPLGRSAGGSGASSVRRPEVAPPRQPNPPSEGPQSPGSRQQQRGGPGQGRQPQRQRGLGQQARSQQARSQQARSQQAQRRAAAERGSGLAQGQDRSARGTSAQRPMWAKPVERGGHGEDAGSRQGQSPDRPVPFWLRSMRRK